MTGTVRAMHRPKESQPGPRSVDLLSPVMTRRSLRRGELKEWRRSLKEKRRKGRKREEEKEEEEEEDGEEKERNTLGAKYYYLLLLSR